MEKRRSAGTAALLMTIGLLAAGCAGGGGGPSNATGGPTTAASGTAGSAAPSSPASNLDAVLTRALTEEHQAKASYDNVLATLGNVGPFPQIASAEGAHVAALEKVARAHGVDVAGITATGTPSPSTLAQACQMGVAAEKADVALYDELLPQVTGYPDVTAVFTNLRAASQDSHLPAFERCA